MKKKYRRNIKKSSIIFVLTLIFTTNTYGRDLVFISPDTTTKEYLPVIEGPVVPSDHVSLLSSEEYPYSPAYYNNNISQKVQLLHWDHVSNILPQNTPFRVYDVYTGISYYMISFSHGRHADVRPASHADTELLFYTFGQVWSWDVRPVHVFIGDIVVAASINGFPHGGVAKNGMNGHVCLHFFGSSVHNGNADFARLHQDVVMNAYNHAP